MRKNIVASFVEFYYKLDWLTGYFRITRLCYCQRFKDVCKTLTNVVEAYFLSWNRATNIITLNARVLSLNFWYKHTGTWLICSWKLFTNQKQIICVVVRKQVILNRLEDLLALNPCAQNSSMSKVIVEGFKIEQSRAK